MDRQPRNQKPSEKQRKIKLLKLKGGCCIVCGFNKSKSALDFHHLDPSKKDPDIVLTKNMGWDKLITEVNKCVILCSNCHRMVHAGEIILGT